VGSATKSLAIVVGLGFLLQGIGYGFLRPPITTALTNSVEQQDFGLAAASERLMGQIGVAFGITTMVAVYAGDVDRFATGFVVGAVLAIVASAICLAMRPGLVHGPASSPVEVALDETAYEETALGVPVVVRPSDP
jgi:hypothetical protein